MFITALFTIAKTWKQPKCPSIDEWIKKTWHIYTHTHIYIYIYIYIHIYIHTHTHTLGQGLHVEQNATDQLKNRY